MAELSKIQWTEATWNPWHGCKKVSAGCKYCYMYRDKEKYGQDPTIVQKSKTKFSDPLKWKEPKLIFTCSWSDWFIDEADGWRDEAWAIIKATPQHTYQILTKRPERIADHLPADWGEGYPNVWLGVSVEDQKAANERIPVLMSIHAKVRFLSCEPLLGPVDLTNVKHRLCDYDAYLKPVLGNTEILDVLQGERIHGQIGYSFLKIDWVIVGGESGNDNGPYLYRPCELEWLHSLITQCYRYGVPLFMKQLGTYLSKELKLKDRHGGNMDEFPDHLKIRQFPVNA